MEKLIFDTGIREFAINDSGVLRFNPSDPNVYNRFMASRDRITALAELYNQKEVEAAASISKNVEIDKNGFSASEKKLEFMREIDLKVKEELANIFGAENDFDAIFSGVNLMATATNGEMVIANFFNAILPLMDKGIRTYAESMKRNVLDNARMNRALRGEGQ